MTSQEKFTKWDLLLTVAGFLLYLTDVATDLWVAALYLSEGHYIWCMLVLAVTLVSAAILQSFSWAWYKDDEERQQSHSEAEGSHNQVCPTSCLRVFHIFQMGMPVRFINALVIGYKAAIKQKNTHMDAIYAITDLSMLRLFEAFLETVPQLILQTFILLVSADRDYIQYGSVITSCMSISWATLDYYAALKKSLPAQDKLTCGFPYMIYFFYKLLTLGARILSITLLAILHSVGAAAYLVVLWLIMFICVFRQKTTFSTSNCQEIIYRTVVGIILVFTFFNIKGQKTRVVMALYYIFRIIETTVILLLFWFLKNALLDRSYDMSISISIGLSITIGLALVVGICSLVLYHSYFHPHVYSQAATDEELNNSCRFPDEVDGVLSKSSAMRLNNIIENNSMIHKSVPDAKRGNDRITNCLTL